MDIYSIMKESRARPGVAEFNARIAGRVRALRAGRDLSLDALAAGSGVSRSMLSLIERGEISPTAVVLNKVATGLGVSLATLFEAESAAPDPLSRGADRSSWRDPQSGYVRRNISPPGYPSPIQIVEVRFPPGGRVAYENGARDIRVHQQVWVLEGQIEISVGAVTQLLEQDDCLAMQLDEPTAFRNRTRKPARYVVVLSPERLPPPPGL